MHQYFLAAALGLELAASSSFRVSVPRLAASVAHRLGWRPASAGFEWLASPPALWVLGTATAAELLGYSLPVVAPRLDTLPTPAALVAGALLMTFLLP